MPRPTGPGVTPVRCDHIHRVRLASLACSALLKCQPITNIMTKKAALGVPSSQPHVNSPRLDKEDLSDDEDALAFRKPILGELCMSLRGGCVSRTHLGCTSHRLVRSGRREFAPSCLCGAALHCCRCDNHSRLGTNTVCVLAMHRSFVDSLSTVQVRRWFTSDNTFLRPIIISFVGAVAVLLPVPLTVCPSCRLLKPSLMFSPLTLCSCLAR